MLHTLKEAVVLTGKSRRTLYNHSNEGRVSYSIGPDGRRYFETSELIRVYGPLHAVAQVEAKESAQGCTPSDEDVAQPLTEATARRLAEAIEKLIALEEQKLKLLEHKPEPAPPKPVAVTPIPTKTKASSFADLLDSLDD